MREVGKVLLRLKFDSGHQNILCGVTERTILQLADAAVDELCERDIWRGFPGGLPADQVPGKDNLTSENVSLEWSACIRAGRSDAILALLITLTPNLESLELSHFNTDVAEEGEELANDWDDFRIDNDSAFLQRMFRGATNSQMAAVGNESMAEGKHKDKLLPSLRSINSSPNRINAQSQFERFCHI